ncbi:MAG: GAF domain-containing sensor histidine kinase, partial [Deltaproteobacteria bacterium]|nr:GAF domain-containing sensor histidine kinase [Deltaproteobacteria bacterium]
VKEFAQQSLLIGGIRRHQHVGFLVLADKRGGEGFSDGDTQMLTAVTEHAAVAIENARLFAEARDAAAEQRGLLHAVIGTQEQERQRVAEEWHERLGAKLFDVLQGLRSCQNLIVQRVPETKERFEKLAAEIDTMAALVRGFTNEMHPSVLDDFGFVAALREYVAGLSGQDAFRVTVQAEEVDQHLPSEANLTLFRITQEALRNIRKHARARNVQIAFVQEHAGVSLMIKDDGQGFNPEQPSQGHYGLLYMRERVEACGGTFHVVSARGQGTEVRVDFPGSGKTAANLSRREHPF